MAKIRILIIAIVVVMSACSTNLDNSIEYAGENRSEIKNILKHFENDSNPLKYEAALFLIENMPYHHTFDGEAVDKIDELYLNTSKEALNKRTEIFNKNANSIKASMPPMYDITKRNS